MPVVACPRCGMATDLPVINQTADEFCPKCDFPLFWASLLTASPVLAAETANLRRLPGSGGRRTVGSLACPRCGELNEVDADACIRCGSELAPQEAAPSNHLATPVAYEPSLRNEHVTIAIALCVVAIALAVLLIVSLVR